MERIMKHLMSSALVLSVAFGSCSGVGGRADGDGRSPNVVIILIDALRADHLGCYGYPRETTPHLDALSKEAVMFTRAVSASSWTKPSIPSLFTSLYPSRHGVFEGSSKDTEGHITSDILSDSLFTIAELFKSHGYRTAAFVHNAQLRGFLGFSQGFDLYEDNGGDAREINSAFLSWLRGHEEKEPFFAYLHYLDVHWPYQPPPPYDTMFGTYRSRIDFYTEEWDALREKINEGELGLGGEEIAKMISLYDGELRHLDEQLGALFHTMRNQGFYDNTMLIVTADHGEEFLEHGEIGHGQALYQELLWVPLLVKFPYGEWRGRKADSQAELVDILPTLVEYCRWEEMQDPDGHSLLPHIRGEGSYLESSRYAYSELLHRGEYQRAVIRDGYKLIEIYSGNFRRQSPAGRLAGYHIGKRVEIEGSPSGDGTFVAEKIALDDNQDDDDHEIEGPIGQIQETGEGFSLMGFAVLPEADIEVKGREGQPLALGDLAQGTRVKVNGHVRDRGSFEANRVRVRDENGSGFSLEGVIEDIRDTGSDTTVISLMGLSVLVIGETVTKATGAETAAPQEEPSLVRAELYHLAEDPGERSDLSPVLPRVARELRTLAEEKLPSIVDGEIPGFRETRELDRTTIEELRAIGYVEEK